MPQELYHGSVRTPPEKDDSFQGESLDLTQQLLSLGVIGGGIIFSILAWLHTRGYLRKCKLKFSRVDDVRFSAPLRLTLDVWNHMSDFVFAIALTKEAMDEGGTKFYLAMAGIFFVLVPYLAGGKP